MYKNTNLENNFTGLEKEILEFWKQNGIIEKNLNMNDGKKQFTFYDGPPTANGMPHAGHILTRVIKDIIPRYKVMKGYNVERKAGWDTPVSYTHLTLPTTARRCRSRWSPYH